MTEWDPYYLRRGMRRQLPDHHRRDAREHRHRVEERQRKEREDAEADQSSIDALLDIAMLEQAQAMRRRLDRLDERNTAALIQNTEDIEAVRERILDLLSAAFVLPDGTRVFKTEDGSQVFDEFGNEVSPEVVDPDQIGEDRPSWEDYQAERKELKTLETQRQELLERQQRIDEARHGVDNGSLSQSELDDLEAEFKTSPLDNSPQAASHATIELTKGHPKSNFDSTL